MGQYFSLCGESAPSVETLESEPNDYNCPLTEAPDFSNLTVANKYIANLIDTLGDRSKCPTPLLLLPSYCDLVT